MNKKYFTQLACYNYWADYKVMEWLHEMEEEQWRQVMVSSFNSIQQTATHIASAEKIWVDFWNKVPDALYLSATFAGTKEELIAIWEQSTADVRAFIEAWPEENYLQPVTFRYPKGGEGQLLFMQTFTHLINHSAYHRGQLVTLLRQAGFTRLSSTDLATYYLTAGVV